MKLLCTFPRRKAGGDISSSLQSLATGCSEAKAFSSLLIVAPSIAFKHRLLDELSLTLPEVHGCTVELFESEERQAPERQAMLTLLFDMFAAVSSLLGTIDSAGFDCFAPV